MNQIDIHKAKTNLLKLIKKVINGEEIIIAKDNKPLVGMISMIRQNLKEKLELPKVK